MPTAELWRHRQRVATAMALLAWARLVVAAVPFERWRRSLGGTGDGAPAAASARRIAAQVERAAEWLPFETKCLPRAMALSWMLRRAGTAHAMVFAVRPPHLRGSADALHAWVEVEGSRIIGDLPGPWIETLRLGA